MMKTFAIYDNLGRISKMLQAPSEDYVLERGNFLEVFEDGDDSSHYIDLSNHQFCRKLDYSLEFIPLPSILTIEGIDYHVNSQPEFEFDTPGTYIINVVPESPKYLEKEFEYVVEA